MNKIIVIQVTGLKVFICALVKYILGVEDWSGGRLLYGPGVCMDCYGHSTIFLILQ